MSQAMLFDINARMTSWEFIIDSRLDRLPVNLFRLCADYGVPVYTYREFARRIEKPVEYIIEKYCHDGFCIAHKEQYYIVYNADALDARQQQWTIAHELAHLSLGHIGPELSHLEYSTLYNTRPEEQEANKFALRLLCPSIVLHLCGVRSPGEICELCDVGREVADLRWEHLQKLRAKKRFLIKDEERKVMNQFGSFICGYVAEKLT